MKSLLGFCFLMLSLTAQAEAARTYFFDGNTFRQELLESNDPRFIFMARGYIAGISEMLNGKTYCSPGDIPMSQLVAVVSKYFNEHPDLWQYPAKNLVQEALEESFPCNNYKK